LLTDAPCHGRQYHDYSDNYPDGDPYGRTLEEQIIQYANRKIFFTAIKLGKSTDKMFGIMDKEYFKVTKRHIPIKDLGSGVDF